MFIYLDMTPIAGAGQSDEQGDSCPITHIPLTNDLHGDM